MIIIREAKIKDVNNIAKVHVDTWNTTYSDFIPKEELKCRTYEWQANKWMDRMFNNITKEFMYVAENSQGEIIGFASGETNKIEEKYDSILYTIYILKNYQRQGVGKRLFKVVADRLRSEGAENMVVWTFNENKSRGFYERLGGSLVDKKKIFKDKTELEEVAYIFYL
ncbi:GNAT family N-acetyltransferase [Clostridium acetobutylicum]|uniref:GNAT family N-acetyltransferase n=1 Tax=Clostridium acetobutylicum TaxID=1488 RepID=UPI0028526D8B|nr:GNAT family N-acetyltransferase [Clostridium acetobutylicum]